jgi:dihydrofolate reductase
MRKIIESTLVSLDGVTGDPHVWAMERFDDDAQKEALEGLRASDAMLLGRRTYEIFAGVWPARTGAYAERLNTMPKYVFSSTLRKVDWNNSTIIRGDVVAEATKLKQQDGKALIIYGHGLLGQTLLQHHLLDEVHLSVHPVLVGRGKLLFHEGAAAKLELISAKPRRNGVVVLSYKANGVINHT